MTCTPQPTMVHHSLGAWALFHATQAVGFYLIAAGLAGLALLWGAILLGRRRG